MVVPMVTNLVKNYKNDSLAFLVILMIGVTKRICRFLIEIYKYSPSETKRVFYAT